MALPNSRATLQEYCLRKLGFPVITINVDPDQLDDRIDDALNLFQQFHVDGTQKIYIAYQLTANDMTNQYVTMPNTVIGVNNIYPIAGDSINSTGTQNFNIFDINYQIRLNELYDFTSADYVYFELANQHIQTLQMLFFGEVPFTYNRYTNIVTPQLNWGNQVIAGSWLLFESYQILGNTVDFWGDSWLTRYTTACFKEQWGNNLKKFRGVKLPGGIELDGETIYTEAVNEKKELYEELRSSWEAPPTWLVG
jgi:hypothetical protein